MGIYERNEAYLERMANPEPPEESMHRFEGYKCKLDWKPVKQPVILAFYPGPSMYDPTHQIHIAQLMVSHNGDIQALVEHEGVTRNYRRFQGWWMKPLARFLCWYFGDAAKERK